MCIYTYTYMYIYTYIHTCIHAPHSVFAVQISHDNIYTYLYIPLPTLHFNMFTHAFSHSASYTYAHPTRIFMQVYILPPYQYVSYLCTPIGCA